MSTTKKVLDLSNKKQVFIDGLFLDQSFGVKLEVHQQVKTGEVALRCDKPWEKCTGPTGEIVTTIAKTDWWRRKPSCPKGTGS